MKVLAYPDPFLRKKALPVQTFDEALVALADEMSKTMIEEDGLGLAATQIGEDKRLFVIDPFAFEGEAAKGKPHLVFVNPEIVARSDEAQAGEEGCLSFPGVFIRVERPLKVTVKAQDAQGRPFELSAEGLGARAILHENDHLDGVVMVDRVSHLSRSRALKKHERNLKAEKAAAEKPKKA